MTLTSNQQMFLKQLAGAIEILDEKHTALKILVYGDSGVGKTVLAMRLAQQITPKDKSIVYIDSAQGWVSLENHKALKVRTNYINWERIGNLEALEALAAGISQGIHPWSTVGTIVLDEATSLANDDLDKVVFERSKTTAGKDPDTPSQPDYNTSTNRVRKFYGDLVSLSDTNLILACHQRSDKDNLQREKIQPAFLPKLNQHIRGMMHVVTYVTADMINRGGVAQYSRQFQFHPTTRIVAKTRVGGLPPVGTDKDLLTRVKEWMNNPEENMQKTEPKVAVEIPQISMEGEQ